MAFLDFDKLGDQISSKGKEVVDKAKKAAEIAKLNANIASEEGKLTNIYASIGKEFFDSHAESPEESYEKDFEAVKTAKAAIEKLKFDLQNIKGVHACPNCGADVPLNAAFCSACGAKNDVVEPATSEEPKETETTQETTDTENKDAN